MKSKLKKLGAALVFLMLFALLFSIPVVGEKAGEMLGQPGNKIVTIARSVLVIALGLYLISTGVAALAFPVLGIALIVIGLALVTWGAWPLFKRDTSKVAPE
jgi:hypothetical protein